MNKIAGSVILFFLFVGMASAGTVVITGSCSSPNPRNTTFLFSLSNSGNDTAENITLVPLVFGATPINSSYSLSSLPPGATDNLTMGVSNITEPGAHAARVVALYSQGPSYFSAVFPCLLYFYNTTASEVAVAVYATPLQNGTAYVKVALANAGSNSILANVSLVLPPAFNATSASYKLNLTAHGSANVTFRPSLLPSLEVSSYSAYGAAAFVSYSSGNLSYATMQIFALSPASPFQPNTAISSVFILVAVVIVAISALIIYSVLNKRRKR